MDSVFLVCAIIGGTFLVGQLVLGLLGLGHDTDHDASGGDHSADSGEDSSWFAGALSVRAISSAVLLFGLVGMAAWSAGKDTFSSLAFAFLGGVAALFLVARLMRLLSGLSEDGTVHIENSIDQPATVYLTIPGNKAGAGKVHFQLQNRTVEYQAVTSHPDSLPTGSRVKVVAVVNSDTVEVLPEILTSEKSHA